MYGNEQTIELWDLFGSESVVSSRLPGKKLALAVRLTSRPGGIISWLNLCQQGQQGMSVSLFEFRCAFDAASPFL
jgi:hypothetical protein